MDILPKRYELDVAAFSLTRVTRIVDSISIHTVVKHCRLLPCSRRAEHPEPILVHPHSGIERIRIIDEKRSSHDFRQSEHE
jgi:hypothetical protein